MREVILPPHAKTILVELQGAAGDAEDAMRSASDRLNGLGRDADEAVVARLQRRRQDEGRRQAELMGLLNNIKAWLTHLPAGTVLEPIEQPVIVQLAKGETAVALVEKTRGEISALQSRLSNVAEAPPPKNILKQQAVEQTTGRAKRGGPHRDIGSRGFKVDWAAGDFLTREDVADMFAYFVPDAVIARDEEWIDETPTRTDALPAAERAQRAKELELQIEALERFELGAIALAGEQGICIPVREDITPATFLDVRVARRAAQAVA